MISKMPTASSPAALRFFSTGLRKSYLAQFPILRVMEPQHIKANLQVIAASVIYGFSGIFFMYVKNMSAGTVVFYQLLFGLLALAGYLAIAGKLSGIRFRGKQKTLILLGAWQAGAMLSYYTAVSFTNVSISVLLLYTAPFYVLLLAPVLLKEKYSKKSLAALILSLAGVVIVIGPENLVSGSRIEPGYLFGVLMGLFSGLFYAFITVTSRYLRDEYSAFEQIFISTCVTLVLLLPFIGQTPGATLIDNLPILLFLGVTITSVGSILYFTGLVHIKAQNASILSLLEPVSTIFFAYLLLKDPISTETLLGCVLILSSSFLASLEEESLGNKNIGTKTGRNDENTAKDKAESKTAFREKLPGVPELSGNGKK